MRHASTLFLGAAVALAAAAAGRAYGEGEAATPPSAGPVVYVNLDRVFRDSKDGKSLVDRLRLNAEAHDKAMTERADRLKRAISDLRASLQPDTPEFRTEWKNIETRKWELDFDDRAGREELNRMRVDGMLAIHRQVRALCEQMVEEKGWAAVHQFDPEAVSATAPDGSLAGLNEISLQIATRPVLAVRPGNDVTDLVLEQMGK